MLFFIKIMYIFFTLRKSCCFVFFVLRNIKRLHDFIRTRILLTVLYILALLVENFNYLTGLKSCTSYICLARPWIFRFIFVKWMYTNTKCIQMFWLQYYYYYYSNEEYNSTSLKYTKHLLWNPEENACIA